MAPSACARRAARGALAAGLAAAAASGCDVPTELPRWSTRWAIPLAGDSLPVAALLPDGVTETPDGTAFALALPSVTLSRTLARLCPPCRALDGAVVPKPGFTAVLRDTVPLPEGVVSVRVSRGRIRVRLRHDLAFDPLRPPGGAGHGLLTVTASSGGRPLARDSVSGAATAFPPGVPISRTLPLAPGAVAGPVEVAVSLWSPAGGPARLDARAGLSVLVAPVGVRVAEARVRLRNRRADLEAGPLDLSAVDAGVAERATAGTLRLRIDNPFEATGTLRLVLEGTGEPVRKAVPVERGDTEVAVELDGEELRRLIGSRVRVSGRGTFRAPSGSLVLRPAQALVVGGRLDLALDAGGG